VSEGGKKTPHRRGSPRDGRRLSLRQRMTALRGRAPRPLDQPPSFGASVRAHRQTFFPQGRVRYFKTNDHTSCQRRNAAGNGSCIRTFQRRREERVAAQPANKGISPAIVSSGFAPVETGAPSRYRPPSPYGGLRAINPANAGGLCAASKAEKAYPVRDIGNRITIGVNLSSYSASGAKGSDVVGHRRVLARRLVQTEADFIWLATSLIAS